jgi:hypothetical protein
VLKQTPADYVVADFIDLGIGGASVPGGVVDSRTLFNNSDRLSISHNGEDYLLRITRNGKLILTK